MVQVPGEAIHRRWGCEGGTAFAALRSAASSRLRSRRSFTSSHTAHPSGTRNPIAISIAIGGKPPLVAMVSAGL
jgi:hypothetical protein